MIAQEDIDDLKEEKRKNIGPVKNHCPFDCHLGDLDEYGYCEHLVGFTNEPRIGGRIECLVTNQMYEVRQVNGCHARKGPVPPSTEVVQKSDELVNPEEKQFVNGTMNTAKMWVSARVYRRHKVEGKKAS